MALAEFIAEHLFSMADLSWSSENRTVRARFAAEEIPIEVTFEPRGAGAWVLSFELLEPTDNAYLAFWIFNGVVQAAEEFLSVREPQALVFVSKRPELEQIYETYLGREQHRLAELGYQLAKTAVEPYTEFRITRTRP